MKTRHLDPLPCTCGRAQYLSDHKRNTLRLIAREKTAAEIANMLFLSPKTIANHRNNISKKLGLSGEQNGLMKWALARKEELR